MSFGRKFYRRARLTKREPSPAFLYNKLRREWREAREARQRERELRAARAMVEDFELRYPQMVSWGTTIEQMLNIQPMPEPPASVFYLDTVSKVSDVKTEHDDFHQAVDKLFEATPVPKKGYVIEPYGLRLVGVDYAKDAGRGGPGTAEAPVVERSSAVLVRRVPGEFVRRSRQRG